MTPTARWRDDVHLGQNRETETGLMFADCGKKRDNDDPARVPAVAATTLQEPDEKAPRRHSEFAQRGPWVAFPCAQRGPWAPSPFLRAQAGPVFGQVTPHRDNVMSFSFRPPLPGDGLPLTHSPRREVVSGSVTRRVPTLRLLGVLLWQLGNGLFGLPAWGSEGAP